MINFIKRWRIRNKARQQLRSMTDRELKDLGISRGDIDRIVK